MSHFYVGLSFDHSCYYIWVVFRYSTISWMCHIESNISSICDILHISSVVWPSQNVRRIVRRQLPILRRRLDRQMTAMVLIRVVFFVCLALSYSSYRIYAINSPVSTSQTTEFAIRQLLQAVFGSIATLIYTVKFSFY